MMMTMTRVRHAETLAEGEAAHFTQRLTTLDEDKGPWMFVRFDDGLDCWCPTSRLEVWTVLGWMPAAGTAVPS